MAAEKPAAVAGSFRFPPTTHLRTEYSHIVPDKSRRCASVREFELALERREEEGEDGSEGCFRITLPPPPLPPPHFPPPHHPSPATALHGELTNQIAALQRSLYIQQQHVAEAMPLLRSLITAAHDSPAHTAEVLCGRGWSSPSVRCFTRRPVVRCAGGGCGRRVVPFSRYCLTHICLDPDQVLYGKCTSTDASTLTRCQQAVYDILLAETLCTKHMTPKAVGGKPLGGTLHKRNALSGKGKKGGSGQRGKRAGRGAKTSIKSSQSRVHTASQPSQLARTQVGVSSLSSSSWSSGSDSEATEGHAPQRGPENTNPEDGVGQDTPPTTDSLLPTLPSDIPAFAPPLSTLHLLPPLPELGKIMEDSSSTDDEADHKTHRPIKMQDS